MKTERERKFLVRSDAWRGAGEVVHMRQGFLSTDRQRVVRVRVSGNQAWLTIKGAAHGALRPEYEYAIPVDDARDLLTLCRGSLIEKRRCRVAVGEATWEVDEFLGDNAGLVVAEIEIDDEARLEAAVAARPAWVGKEITEDGRFANARLAERPWSRWSADERAALDDPGKSLWRG